MPRSPSLSNRELTRIPSEIHAIRVSSTKLIRPDDLAAYIENMYPTEEGTLRSIWGPCPYLPNYTTGGAPASGSTASVGTLPAGPTYAPTKGICHARLSNGQREVLLVHTGTQLWVFEGWNRAWRQLIGPAGEVVVSLEDSTRPQFATQFVVTPTGIVIIPQERRAYFYDGTVILPLGYDQTPSPPQALGPENSANKGQDSGTNVLPGTNDVHYAHDGLPHRFSAMNMAFGRGRIGLVVHPTNYTSSMDSGGNQGNDESAIMGWLEPGLWRTRVQWVDRWGNLSPVSGPSEDITVSRQVATGLENFSILSPQFYCVPELVLKQFAWEGIRPGPEGTIGRILYRTKDQKQSGDPNYWELPLNATPASGAFATLPDNVSHVYTDNIPDMWLTRKLEAEIVPVPLFRLGAVAFGRLWIAADGWVRPSMVGRWGTFQADEEIYPDPSGAGITALHTVPRGLLLFTDTSTFLVEASDDGKSFRTMPISTRIGCVAPDSIVSLRGGEVVWLGKDGFYQYDGESIQYIFEDQRRETRKFTHARLCQATAVFVEKANEYRCWVSTNGSVTNNLCYCLSETGWRRRTDLAASGAVVTRDHRSYVLVAGQEGGANGVWVQDIASGKFTPTSRSHVIETGWINSTDSVTKRSLRRIELWLRETSTSNSSNSAKIQIEVMRDWRETVQETAVAEKYRESDTAPEFWGTAVLNATGAKWRGKRPYWSKADVSVPSCEVFKLRLTSTTPWEFIGIRFLEHTHMRGGADKPP